MSNSRCHLSIVGVVLGVRIVGSTHFEGLVDWAIPSQSLESPLLDLLLFIFPCLFVLENLEGLELMQPWKKGKLLVSYDVQNFQL